MTSQLDDFRAQIASLSDLVRNETGTLEARTRLQLGMEDAYGIRQIILTGSGDSYFAAVAATPAIRAWTGLPVQPMVAMEASRYVDAGVPPLAGRNRGLLVVAVSNSGEAARLVEAAQRMRHLGALVLAVTASPQSRLGKAAERVIDVSVPSSRPAPGTRSYVASLLGLHLFGIRLAEMLMRMTMDEANALRAEIASLAEAVDRASANSDATLKTLATTWRNHRSADCLGSGPSFGSACYAAAKLVEAAGVHASAQDAEEFHHLNYFVDRPAEVPAILFAPGNALSVTRTRELSRTLLTLGRPYVVVSDDESLAPATNTLLIPPAREWLAPIVQAVPAALLAAYWSDSNATAHYRGHQGPWSGAAGAGLVRNSQIELQS